MSLLLLDTDTCIELLRGNPLVLSHASDHPPSTISASVLTRYELLYGVERCTPKRRAGESEKVQGLFDVICESPFTAKVAQRAAKIRAHLTGKGQTIGAIDILIAATAIVENRTLITHNLREFERIPNLRCQSWNNASG